MATSWYDRCAMVERDERTMLFVHEQHRMQLSANLYVHRRLIAENAQLKVVFNDMEIPASKSPRRRRNVPISRYGGVTRSGLDNKEGGLLLQTFRPFGADYAQRFIITVV